MSYDFHLFKPVEGAETLETARVTLETETEELNPGLPDARKEQQKRQNAALLQMVNHTLEIFSFDYAEIARASGSSETDARTRFRHLELNGPKDGNGIQITLADDTASITVPYWHTGDRAKPVLDEVWQYLLVLERRSGFLTYDPQLERVLRLDSDLPEVVERYRAVADRLPEIAARKLDERRLPIRRPWWKFW
jgi:hypothetical protein